MRALALTGAVVLTACSSGPAGSDSSTAQAVLPLGPSASASSPTASAGTSSPGSPSPAPLPAAAREHTPKGAEAFVRHFLAEYNRAVTTPAPGLLRPMSLPSCKTCAGLEDDVTALIKDGEKYLVAPVRIDAVTCVVCAPAEPTWIVDSWLFSRPAKIANSAGVVMQITESSSDLLDFSLQWKSGQWTVSRIRLVKP